MLDFARPNDPAGCFLRDRNARGLAPRIEFEPMRMGDRWRRGPIFQDDCERVPAEERGATSLQQFACPRRVAWVKRLFFRTEHENSRHFTLSLRSLDASLAAFVGERVPRRCLQAVRLPHTALDPRAV